MNHDDFSDGESLIHNKWVRGGCVLAAFVMAATLFVEADAVTEMLLFLPLFDKVAHFVYYGTMAALLAHGLGLPWLIVPLILVPVIGAADEWHQFYVPGRDASAVDWIADEIGTVFAVVVYWKWRKRP